MVPGWEARGLVAPRRTGEKALVIVPKRSECIHTTSGLDGITTFPNHGADWSAVHVYCVSDVIEVRCKMDRCVHLTSPGKNGFSARSASAKTLAKFLYEQSINLQCFSRCSWPGVVSLMAASLYLETVSFPLAYLKCAQLTHVARIGQ